MRREFRVAQIDEKLEPVLTQLAQQDLRTVPVMQNAQLIGLLTLDNVGEWMMIQTALRSQKTGNPATLKV